MDLRPQSFSRAIYENDLQMIHSLIAQQVPLNVCLNSEIFFYMTSNMSRIPV